MLKHLLKSGDFADVRIVIGEPPSKTFRCHRAVLAARSPAFVHLFKINKAGGELRLRNTRPETFARYLHFCYTGEVPRSAELTAREYLELGFIAYTCKTEALRQFCATMLQAQLTVGNVSELLLVHQKFKEPAHTDILLRFITRHVRAVTSTKSWVKMARVMPGKIGVIVRKLAGVVAADLEGGPVRSAVGTAAGTSGVHRTPHGPSRLNNHVGNRAMPYRRPTPAPAHPPLPEEGPYRRRRHGSDSSSTGGCGSSSSLGAADAVVWGADGGEASPAGREPSMGMKRVSTGVCPAAVARGKENRRLAEQSLGAHSRELAAIGLASLTA